MKANRKLWGIVLALLIAVSAFCGCSAKSANEAAPQADSNGSMYGAMDSVAHEADLEKGEADNGISVTSAAGVQTGSQYERKIITNASVDLETTEFEAAVDGIKQQAASVNGYIESSHETGLSYDRNGDPILRSASFVLRIPSGSLESVRSSLEQYGNIMNSSATGDDVTSAYYDTEARLRQYEAKEERLLEYMSTAATMEDLLDLESALTDVRYQIESMQTNLKMWDELSQYATLSISINETIEPSTLKPTERSFGEKLWETVQRSGRIIVNFLVWLIHALIYLLPFLVFFGAILTIVLLCTRKARKRRRAQAQSFLSPTQATQPVSPQESEPKNE